jgi:hypothetical protein
VLPSAVSMVLMTSLFQPPTSSSMTHHSSPPLYPWHLTFTPSWTSPSPSSGALLHFRGVTDHPSQVLPSAVSIGLDEVRLLPFHLSFFSLLLHHNVDWNTMLSTAPPPPASGPLSMPSTASPASCLQATMDQLLCSVPLCTLFFLLLLTKSRNRGGC